MSRRRNEHWRTGNWILETDKRKGLLTMRLLKTMMLAIAALALALRRRPGIGAGARQPPGTPPAGQPPATQTPRRPAAAAPTPAAAAAAPRRSRSPRARRSPTSTSRYIASNSVEGKAATAKIQEFAKKKTAELEGKKKALEAARRQAAAGRHGAERLGARPAREGDREDGSASCSSRSRTRSRSSRS